MRTRAEGGDAGADARLAVGPVSGLAFKHERRLRLGARPGAGAGDVVEHFVRGESLGQVARRFRASVSALGPHTCRAATKSQRSLAISRRTLPDSSTRDYMLTRSKIPGHLQRNQTAVLRPEVIRDEPISVLAFKPSCGVTPPVFGLSSVATVSLIPVTTGGIHRQSLQQATGHCPGPIGGREAVPAVPQSGSRQFAGG